MPSIIKRTVDATKPDPKNDVYIWDSKIKGFGLRVKPSGVKSYILQYRNKYGVSRRYTIGKHGSPYTAEKARSKAVILLGDIEEGFDPAEEKLEALRDLNVSELCDLYLKEGVSTKKASTIATDKGRIERHIKPLLGGKKIKSLKQSDIEKFLRDIAAGKTAWDEKTKKYGRAIVKGGKGTATRTVGLLGGIMSFANRKGILDGNPVHGVKRYKDNKNERFLSEKELQLLGDALRDAENHGLNTQAIDAIRLLILTGCRKTEILSLEWDHIDWEGGYLRLQESKTGAKVLPVGAPVLEILLRLKATRKGKYVFPATRSEGYFVGLPKVWKKIIESKPELKSLRLHDLRHSFASVAASAGNSLLLIGGLLGHRDPKTTQRYAHLGDDPLKKAANTVSQRISEAMGKNNEHTNERTEKIR